MYSCITEQAQLLPISHSVHCCFSYITLYLKGICCNVFALVITIFEASSSVLIPIYALPDLQTFTRFYDSKMKWTLK